MNTEGPKLDPSLFKDKQWDMLTGFVPYVQIPRGRLMAPRRPTPKEVKQPRQRDTYHADIDGVRYEVQALTTSEARSLIKKLYVKKIPAGTKVVKQ